MNHTEAFLRVMYQRHVHFRGCLQDYVLRGFDQECREFVQQQYGVHGMIMHPENSPAKIEKADGKLKVTFDPKKGDKWTLDGVDTVLMATGRHPLTSNIGLEEVGAALRAVNALCCTYNSL